MKVHIAVAHTYYYPDVVVTYRRLNSLREYVLIDQERQWAEVFRRGTEGWLHEIIRAGEVLALGSLDLRLSMDDVYENSGITPESEKSVD